MCWNWLISIVVLSLIHWAILRLKKIKKIQKKEKESIQNTIQQINQVDLQKINDFLLKPNSQHQATAQAVIKIQEKLPLVHKKVFSFELNENVEPFIFVASLMEMCA
jgi:hypothetical protein